QCTASRMAHPHAAKSAAAGERAYNAQLVAILVAGAWLQWVAIGLRERDRRSASEAVPCRAEERSRGSEPAERAHRADGASVLCRSFRRYAQPHEGSAGAARQVAAGRRTSAAGQDRAR